MMHAKYSIVLATLAFCGVASSQTPVHLSEAVARVQVRVEPQIAVSEPVVVVVDLQDDMIGVPIAGQVQFSVRANTPQVELQVACTDLYKAGNPMYIHSIPVAGTGAEILCEDGPSQLLSWLPSSPAGALPAGWTGSVSEAGVFTSSGRTFGQDVAVDVSWWSPDPDLPIGEYRGIVRLIGMVRP